MFFVCEQILITSQKPAGVVIVFTAQLLILHDNDVSSITLKQGVQL